MHSMKKVDLALDHIREGLRQVMESHPGREADCRIEITLTFKPKVGKVNIRLRDGWLKDQMEKASEEVKNWPDWMKLADLDQRRKDELQRV